MSEFINMGDYAVYVWSSYALMVLVLLANIWLPLRRQRQQKKRIYAQQNRGNS